jgi:hypothetical protein
MEKINLNELADYEEDAKGLSNFQKPYLPPSLLGLAITLGGFVLLISEMEASHYYRGEKAGTMDLIWFRFEKMMHAAGSISATTSYLPTFIFVAGLLIFLATMFVMSRATPVSSISGQKMEKYWNANPDRGAREIIYVDRPSKTYFRRVFASSGGPRQPSVPFYS